MRLAIAMFLLLAALIQAEAGPSARKAGYAEAMKALSSLMSAKPAEGQTQPPVVDFTAVEKVYRDNFGALTAAYGQAVDRDIDSAFARAKRGEDIKLQKQWIEKNLQRVIYHSALKALDRVPADKGAPDSAAALLACLETVMERRTKWLNIPFKDQVAAAVAALKSAAPKEAAAQAAEIRKIMTKVYLLSVLWETRGLAAAQAKHDGSSMSKRVEGMIYFNILAPAIPDKAIRNFIAGEWNKAPDLISVQAIRKGLGDGLPDFWKELPDSVRSN